MVGKGAHILEEHISRYDIQQIFISVYYQNFIGCVINLLYLVGFFKLMFKDDTKFVDSK
jgi:hypothetical protein